MRCFLLLVTPMLLLGAVRPPRRPTPPGPAHAAASGASVAPGAVLPNVARQALLARASLGRLWQHQPQSGSEDVLNGCFGYEGRRLEFVFLRVQADAKCPGRYLVAGKFRCYGEVTPFRGSVEVQQVQRLPSELARGFAESDEPPTPVYCAIGSFALQATSPHGLGGRFEGRLALDFQLNRSGRAELADYTANPATRRGGLLFDGIWRDADGGVPALWKQGPVVTHQVLTRFRLRGRGPHIDPKYAHVGWNTYWQNEEWWVEKAVARR